MHALASVLAHLVALEVVIVWVLMAVWVSYVTRDCLRFVRLTKWQAGIEPVGGIPWWSQLQEASPTSHQMIESVIVPMSHQPIDSVRIKPFAGRSRILMIQWWSIVRSCTVQLLGSKDLRNIQHQAHTHMTVWCWGALHCRDSPRAQLGPSVSLR